jgi:hypothetical protein
MADTKTVVSAQSGMEAKNDAQVKNGETVNIDKVTVTIIPDQEIAAILTIQTDKIIKQAFSLQEDYDNESQFRRDALHDASILFLKASCQRAINTWDNLVTKHSKLTRYRNVGREQVEASLRDNPKTRPYFQTAQKATAIKNALK